MKPFVTTGRVIAGKLRVRNRDRMAEHFKAWKQDAEVTVTIEKAHATRSLEQNALYWVAYVNPLSEHTGMTPKEMHEYLKARFLPTHQRKTKTLLLHNRHGEVIDEYEVDLSTTTALNKVDFTEYLQAIDVFAAELGVQVGSNQERAYGVPA